MSSESSKLKIELYKIRGKREDGQTLSTQQRLDPQPVLEKDGNAHQWRTPWETAVEGSFDQKTSPTQK